MKPHNVSFEQAASVPVAGLTALGEVAEAVSYVEEGHARGKVIIDFD
jgi:NADPH:quinone reductase-like Zn-dependent oxidoreductase